MLYRDICRTLSFFLWILLIPLTFPLGIAVYCQWIAGPEVYPQHPSLFAFFITIIITALLAFLCHLIGKSGTGHLFRREGLLLVIVIWFLTPLIGALPFWISQTLTNPFDAYFEAVSGFTTTGAGIMSAKEYDASGNEIPIRKTFLVGKAKTYEYYGNISPIRDPKTHEILLTGIDAVSPALLFWRALTQWLGGVGIIVLFVAILPALGVGGKVLYQSEVTGPTKESIAPRIKDTASQLWKIYLGLTLLQIFLLMITNAKMSFFDATTITFSTLSTGGFTPNNGSIAAYNNAYTDWIIVAFMIMGSISFSTYFFIMQGKFGRLKEPELRVFLAILLITALYASFSLVGMKKTLFAGRLPGGPSDTYTFWEALRYGTFQVVSMQTSTGFAIANYQWWPFSVQTMMLVQMFIGGMAGSTAGGLKVVRLQMYFRILVNKIEQIFRPDTIRTYRVGAAQIDQNVAITVLCFILIAATLTIIGTFALVMDGLDPETSLTSIANFLNNVGLAFRMAGPDYSFAFLSNFGKILSSVWMIAGRLEYFALLIIFVPDFWRTR
ncbi:MAG: TrkH family potassium uptake protein [Chlamydiia bacterium]|nr:TrkH family potassium uptake protein [Chlamydiia bacterium]